MEFDCLFWNYCLGSTSIVLLFCVMILLILLIRSRRKTSKMKSAVKKQKLDIESGPEETASKQQDLDALKIARKQGTPLPTPKRDNIENPYETIKPKPKENALLASRDSVGDRLKKKILNRRSKRKAVTFNSEKIEVIPDSVEQIPPDRLDQRSYSMSDILDELSTEEIARNRPSKAEPTYMDMLGSKKSKAVAKLNQLTGKSREKSQVCAKSQKPSPLPRGCSVAKINNQCEGETENRSKKTENRTMAPKYSNLQIHQIEYPYYNQGNSATNSGILNTAFEDGYNEDEMYDKQLEKEMSKLKSPDRNVKPILPKKLSKKSQSGLLGVEHRIEDVQNESAHDATSLESYDVPPPPRPVTPLSTFCNALVPPKPYNYF